MSEPRFWIGVVAGDHVAKGVAGGFCMFSHGEEKAIARLSVGDGFAYYSPMSGMKTGETLRAFTAIAIVEDGPLTSQSMGMLDDGREAVGTSRPARYLNARPASIYPLLADFSFVKNQSHWGMYFRKSLFEISRADFLLIAAAMKAEHAFH